MKILFLLISILLLFSGCFNRRGISATYYNDCDEYYDIQGNYHKDCDENMLEYKTVGDLFKSEEEEPDSNVW